MRLSAFSLMVAPIILTISMLMMRPSHIGENLNLIAVLIFTGAALLALVARPISLLLIKRHAAYSICVFLMWLYLAVHSIFMGAKNSFALYSLVLACAISISGLVINSNEGLSVSFRRLFVAVLALLGWSAAVTMVLMYAFGPETLLLFNIPSSTYNYKGNGDIYFPLSMSYTWSYSGFGVFPRFNLFWRESGISQAIYAWAFIIIATDKGLRFRRPFMMGAIFGAIASFSTLSLICIGISIFAYLAFFGSKSISGSFFGSMAGLICLLGMATFAIYDPSSGFLSKLGTASFSDRTLAASAALELLYINPFGYGIYNLASNNDLASGINLIALSAQIGIIGSLMVVATWWIAVASDARPFLKFVALFPFFITALSSQPLLDSMGIYIMMMMPTPKDDFLRL